MRKVTNVDGAMPPKTLLHTLNPIFYWMQLLGMQLDPSEGKHWVISIYGLLTVIGNVAINMLELVLLVKSAALRQSLLIEWSNAFAFAVCVHVAFFCAHRTSWKELMNLVEKTAFSSAYSTKLLGRSRVVMLIRSALIIWVCTACLLT